MNRLAGMCCQAHSLLVCRFSAGFCPTLVEGANTAITADVLIRAPQYAQSGLNDACNHSETNAHVARAANSARGGS